MNPGRNLKSKMMGFKCDNSILVVANTYVYIILCYNVFIRKYFVNV